MTADEQTLDSILVALDGSRPAQTAAALAIQIAKQENLLIHGLSVVDELLVMEPDTGLEKEVSSQPSQLLTSNERARLLEGEGDAALCWLEDCCQVAGVPVQADLMFGGLPDLIIDKAHSARLLALGRRGRSHPHDDARLGDHFRAIAHHTPAPLLIGGDELSPIRRMLLAYDGRTSAKHALSWASLLQHLWQNHLLVLSVANDDAPPHWLEEMEGQLGSSNLVNYRFISRQGDPAAQIVTAVAQENVDLIIMGGYQHSLLREWLTGSALDQVLRSTSIPVFMVGKGSFTNNL